jgi:hypothetical protein
LALYAGADKLVFESGSAIHLLELFGRIKADIAILPRLREAGSGLSFQKSIQPRALKQVWTYSGRTWTDELGEGSIHVRLRRTQLDINNFLTKLSEAKFI